MVRASASEPVGGESSVVRASASEPVVDLDDRAALDAGVVGAKAAMLARARRHGLPALPGAVVALEASRSAVTAAVGQLSRGSGAARLAVMREPVDADLLSALRERAAQLGFPVVVRSSSPLEGDPAWSGAFSSFLDVGADDLATAVRGCWASAFAVDPLERAQHTEVAPDDLTMAVLVQPQVAPDAGGLARIVDGGVVAITATAGSPAPLLAGWERGTQIRVDDAGGVRGDDVRGLVTREVALQIADLARRVRSSLGGDVIEWASAGGRVVLLQWRRSASATATAPDAGPVRTSEDGAGALADGLDDPMALRLARLALRFPGGVGERLVLPWACAVGWQQHGAAASELVGGDPRVRASASELVGGDPRVRASASELVGGDPDALMAEAERRAVALTAAAWDLPPDRARDEAARTLAMARGPEPRDALRRLARLRPVPADEVSAVLGLLAAVARLMVARGALARPHELWWSGAGSHAAPVRDGWEPFVYGAVRAHGERLDGVPAAPGVGAGVVTAITNPHTADVADHRPVLVASRPLPGLAPLMWGAAGLVTGAGSPAAHLLEVAHSLRLPAVVGCPLDERVAAGGASTRLIAAVDGAEGAVFVVPATADGDERRTP